ncbi:MAG: S8 family serine peptidase [Methanospirillaceae archaeon]|nr:S8 family serine peptidase [Methanospirillaceae archaeon]
MNNTDSSLLIGIALLLFIFLIPVVSGQVGSYTEHFTASDLMNKTHYTPDSDTEELLQEAATQRSELIRNSTEKAVSALGDKSEDKGSKKKFDALYVPGEVIIMYKPAASVSSRQMASYAVSAVPDAEVAQDFSITGLPGIVSVELAEGTDVAEAVDTYSESPYVAYAEPNYIISLYLPTDPTEAHEEEGSGNTSLSVADILASMNDPLFPNLWGLHNDGSLGGTADADIDAPEAWAHTTGSSSVVVAVIDTGIDYTHPDLAANIWRNPGEIPGNGIDDDNNGYIDDINGWDFVTNDNDPMDDQGHGTHCAGTIAAVGNNGIGVAGVTWKTKLMPLKFLDANGQGDTLGALNAINYARMMGADILSCSWGSTAQSQAMYDTFSEVPGLIVCAAGNQGSDNDQIGHYPSNFDLSWIIAVAATTKTDSLAGFSNYGKTMVDVAAPGDSIASCGPGSKYVYMSGTSMATPHVSGLAALLKAVKPGLSAVQMKNLIIQGVDPLSSLSAKTVSGGRINAYNSIQAASGGSTPVTTTYTITATAGSGGSVAPAGATPVTSGKDLTVTITPRSGYAIAGLFIDGYSVAVASSYTFTAVSTDHTLSATFSPVPTSTTITASASGGGTITPSGPVSVSNGGTQSFQIAPLAGYQIRDVLVDSVSAGPVSSYTFRSVTTPHTISALFEIIPAGTGVVPLPGQQLKPTSPDNDNLYRDLNGNGRKDFQDVVLYFTYLEWIAANEPVSAFDYSGNGRIDFTDVIQLFQTIS